jgi:hypothetical protein
VKKGLPVSCENKESEALRLFSCSASSSLGFGWSAVGGGALCSMHLSELVCGDICLSEKEPWRMDGWMDGWCCFTSELESFLAATRVVPPSLHQLPDIPRSIFFFYNIHATSTLLTPRHGDHCNHRQALFRSITAPVSHIDPKPCIQPPLGLGLT